MRKFRLKLARQSGEQIAKKHGFNTFPVIPSLIAEKEDILLQAKPPDQQGVSGYIVFNDDGVGIGYSTSIQNKGFVNFTIAHELGHYFLEGHPEEIMKVGGFHASRAGFTEGNSSIELEADHFASGLLMPTNLVKEVINTKTVDMEGIQFLSEKAESSLTASAIRAAECASFPIAIIVSSGNKVCYGFMSDSFKSLGKLHFLRKGDELPTDSATLEFNRTDSNVLLGKAVCANTRLSSWFGELNDLSLDEEIKGLGRYGLTLTILSSDSLTSDPYEEGDEEQNLEESWTPKFAYGR